MFGDSPSPSTEIDQLALAAIAQADASAGGAEAPAVETPGGDAGGLDSGQGPNTEFCRDLVSSALGWHADSVRAEFFSALSPKIGEAQAKRIADRAAMAPNLQATIADHSARVLDKYGLAKYINSEAVLVSAFVMYLRELSLARKERDEILNPPKPAQASP